jgi:aldose sugar dehydrogenase
MASSGVGFGKSHCLGLKFLLTVAATTLLITSHTIPSTNAAQPVLSDPHLQIDTVTQGLRFPTGMVFLNSNEILVLEKDQGKVRKVMDGNLTGKAELAFDVDHIYERGLIGIAIQMKQKANTTDKQSEPEYLFLFLTEPRYKNNSSLNDDPNGTVTCTKNECEEIHFNNRLYRYEYKDNKWVNPKLLFDIPINWNNRVYPTAYSAILHGGSNWSHYPIREGIHQGGKLLLDKDDNLFLVTGDGGGCRTQDGCDRSIKNGFLSFKSANNLGGADPVGTGAILHLTNDGRPVDNKGIFGGSSPLKYYYAYGIRNSFGLDIDPITGKLWDTENGPHYGDEINLVEPGFNSGWAKIQGVWPVTNYKDLWFNATEKGYNSSSNTPTSEELENFNGKGHYSDPELSWNLSRGVTSLKFLDTDGLGKQYENDLLVGDAYGNIYHFNLNENRTQLKLSEALSDKIANNDFETKDFIFAQGLDTITDMKVGPDGFLYVLSYSGKIFKISEKIDK